MRRRTFEEMITYFNQTVSEMDIDRKYKMTLIGMVTALLQKHEEDVAQIVRCKDCKHHHRDNSGAYYCGRKDYGYGWGLNDFCSDAERREE